MTNNNISFSQTNLFSKLILDYLSQDENVKPFYNYEINIDAIEKIIEDKKKDLPADRHGNIDRIALVETIKRQYSSVEIHQQVSNNISLLENENTFCIVTAHQLNIFAGPLYYIYKIAQTISTCKQLKVKYPDYNFVPVYWMGSEDHDFEEINHIYLYNKKIEWQDKQGGATGEYSTQSILPLIDEIKTILGESEYVNQLIEIYQKAYTQLTLTQATRYLVNALFGEYGLVVVDGNDKAFKQQYADVMRDELLNQNSVKLVAKQLEQLEAKGYKQQAFPREINLFYLSKNSRERIEYSNDTSQYIVLNTQYKFSKEEILTELQNHPERFSPNVILRPLFQQKVLPSLAYIGGAGELSYWLQLKPVFDFYKVNFPQLLLRNSALLANESISKKIEKIGFKIQDFFIETEELKKEFISKNTEEDIDVSTYKNEIENTFNKIQELTKNIDASLVNAVGAELQKSLQSIDSIQKRLMKSLKQKNETELNHIEKIKTQLFPNNSLQERVENFSVYYSKYGQSFIAELIEQFDIYNRQFSAHSAFLTIMLIISVHFLRFRFKMKTSVVFISLFLLLISAKQYLPPKGDVGYKTFITWNENRKLTWSDFQGKPMDNAAEVAMTASAVEFYYFTKNKQIEWTVTAKYFPKLSWSKKKLQSDYILKHEQLHFDITELYARLFRKRLKESVKSINDEDKLKTISKQIMKEWNDEENDYDRETNHSIDEKKQAEWNLNLQQRLDELKEFASK